MLFARPAVVHVHYGGPPKCTAAARVHVRQLEAAGDSVHSLGKHFPRLMDASKRGATERRRRQESPRAVLAATSHVPYYPGHCFQRTVMCGKGEGQTEFRLTTQHELGGGSRPPPPPPHQTPPPRSDWAKFCNRSSAKTRFLWPFAFHYFGRGGWVGGCTHPPT